MVAGEDLQSFVGADGRGNSESTLCSLLQMWNRLIEWTWRNGGEGEALH